MPDDTDPEPSAVLHSPRDGRQDGAWRGLVGPLLPLRCGPGLRAHRGLPGSAGRLSLMRRPPVFVPWWLLLLVALAVHGLVVALPLALLGQLTA